MASGKTHEKINKLFIVPILIVVICLFIKINLEFNLINLIVFTSVGYLLGTFYLSPDLDIVSRPFNRWGYVRFIWIPYQKMFRHRSIFTHGILIGDVIRILYLVVIFIALTAPFTGQSIKEYSTKIIKAVVSDKRFIYLFIGVFASSTIHVVSDVISSFFVKMGRR